MPVRSSKKPKSPSSKGKGASIKTKPRVVSTEKPKTEKPKGAFSKRLRDVSQLARSILDQVIGHGQMLPPAPTAPPSPSSSRKNPAAVSLGRLGGLKGGKARAAKLTSKKRTAIAKKAATARWGGAKR